VTSRIVSKSTVSIIVLLTLSSLGLAGEPARRALLVGCSKYPEEKRRLLGPTNDVLLMEQVLTTRLRFTRGNIVELYDEQPDEALRPTHAHIVREIEALIEKTRPGDRVVLFFAGHGSQQPSRNLKGEERDGLDETFLPSDVGSWNDATKEVARAIEDDTFDDWLTRLQKKGAHVWFIADSCHSGTLNRGGEEEIVRRIDPADLGVPPMASTELRDVPAIYEEVAAGDLVALFATQPHEAEGEQKLPILSDAGEPHSSDRYYGRLTWALAKTLATARRSLTYAELVDAIHTEHLRQGVLSTPLLQGTAIHKEILGEQDWAARRRFPLKNMDGGKFTLPAGQVHGLTPGSVLAVLSAPTANPPDEVLGHVEVVVSRPLESVVHPVAFAQRPIVDPSLPGGLVISKPARPMARRRSPWISCRRCSLLPVWRLRSRLLWMEWIFRRYCSTARRCPIVRCTGHH
jgi:hypothetical protein